MHQTTPTVYGKLIYTIELLPYRTDVNLNESFAFFFLRLYRQNVNLGLSTKIFSVYFLQFKKFTFC